MDRMFYIHHLHIAIFLVRAATGQPLFDPLFYTRYNTLQIAKLRGFLLIIDFQQTPKIKTSSPRHSYWCTVRMLEAQKYRYQNCLLKSKKKTPTVSHRSSHSTHNLSCSYLSLPTFIPKKDSISHLLVIV